MLGAIQVAALMWIATSLGTASPGQQTASTVEPPRTVDRDFQPRIDAPAYPRGGGPRVLVDEAHRNFHTAVGTYLPFTKVLEQDGYVVERGTQAFSPGSLNAYAVLVIADAQPPEADGAPPTFSPEEITALNEWVSGGGALFLITDHMPDPAPIAELAASFGVEVHNGYALRDALSRSAAPMVFRRSDGTLADHPLTEGNDPSQAIDSVATFAGSAFRAEAPFEPLLIFGPGVESWQPEEYWQFSPATKRVDVTGWYQGGVMEYREGRVACLLKRPCSPPRYSPTSGEWG